MSKISNTHVQDSIRIWKIQDSIQTLIADTLLNPDIVIYEDEYDKRTYKKFDLDSVIKYYPTIIDTTIVADPLDILGRRNFDESNINYRFSCEACLDDFYVIYAYFIKRKTQNLYPKIRKQLFEAYQQINRYYGHWNSGGTYFGHQSWRIIGYVEYDVYCYMKYREEEHSEPNYRKQKELFINMLCQRAIDQTNSLQGVYPKGAKNKMLNAVSKIDKSIDNWFVLQKAILFEKQNYVYE